MVKTFDDNKIEFMNTFKKRPSDRYSADGILYEVCMINKCN